MIFNYSNGVPGFQPVIVELQNHYRAGFVDTVQF
jgi:hypothetical protein